MMVHGNEKTYLNITKPDNNDGAWSTMWKKNGQQVIALSNGAGIAGFWTKANILHEMMHSLGFYHENERPDRDEWVTFHNGETATLVHDIDNLGTPYDYCSVMHPSANKSIGVNTRNMMCKSYKHSIIIGCVVTVYDSKKRSYM